MKLNMICITFDQKIKKPKNLNFALLRFLNPKNLVFFEIRSHFLALPWANTWWWWWWWWCIGNA